MPDCARFAQSVLDLNRVGFRHRAMGANMAGTYVTQSLLSLGHPAKLGAVAVREERGLLQVPVLSVQFLHTETPHSALHRIVSTACQRHVMSLLCIRSGGSW